MHWCLGIVGCFVAGCLWSVGEDHVGCLCGEAQRTLCVVRSKRTSRIFICFAHEKKHESFRPVIR